MTISGSRSIGSTSVCNHRRYRAFTKLSMPIVASVAIAGLLVFAHPIPGSSQGVHLVKVDVADVDQGYRVSKLLGRSVTNDKNEKVGSLDDLVIGHNDSLYAILQVGGFLGIGSRLVAVPYDALKVDDEGRKVELPGASQQELKSLAEVKYRE
jgi:sporulation protein YlmC with PRC-barrel domain